MHGVCVKKYEQNYLHHIKVMDAKKSVLNQLWSFFFGSYHTGSQVEWVVSAGLTHGAVADLYLDAVSSKSFQLDPINEVVFSSM